MTMKLAQSMPGLVSTQLTRGSCQMVYQIFWCSQHPTFVHISVILGER